MKIGVISDTHDRLPTFKKAIAFFRKQNVDAIFHAGDYVAPFAAKLIAPSVLPIPLYCVFGNNDGERKGLKSVLPDLEDQITVTLHNRTIVMSHFIDWLKTDDMTPNNKPADVIITGHTHEIVNETRTLPGHDSSTLFLNPGECCGWLTGRCTVAILDLETVTAEIIDIDD
ncbi:phosphodiesterase [Poriferisphaera corsica]|uniref:Phosphoesterase n=1 Tax=Poriferisphaera corsica TaxID=2528020 RepID=A0A517YRA2_9BACT|nr:metallophosphoesterase [Poriferisphaera corsica]QDU32744.1 phosphodiesterase [Poriferisphaera corsica]